MCANHVSRLSGKKRMREVEVVEDGQEEEQQEEAEQADLPEDPTLYECSVCEAGSQDSCSEFEDEECPHREERAEAYAQVKRLERKKDKERVGKPVAKKQKKKEIPVSASASAAAATVVPVAVAPSPIRKAAGVAFDKPEEILEMSEDQLRQLNVKQIVGIPIAWQAWIKSHPVSGSFNRREAWKDLAEEMKIFFTVDQNTDAKISKLDLAVASRVLEQLTKLLDPTIGYGIAGEAQRSAGVITFFANEIVAFQCARERGWFVARSAAAIEERQHLTLKGRDVAVKKAVKAEKAKASTYKPGGGGGGRGAGASAPKDTAGRGGKGRGRG